MMSVQANTGPEWEEKTSQGFWRGRDSRRERLELVKLSRRNPELIDAALTNFFFFKQNDELYGPKVKHVSFFDFFKVSWGLFNSYKVINEQRKTDKFKLRKKCSDQNWNHKTA